MIEQEIGIHDDLNLIFEALALDEALESEVFSVALEVLSDELAF